jgi:hypothetical protein
MTEVRVDPSVLDWCAGHSRELCHALRSTIALVEPETADAAQGMAGWSTGHSLADVLLLWRDEIERSSGRVGDVGRALHACASDYRRADHYVPGRVTPIPRSR